MIPKRIFTIWLNHDPIIPEKFKKYIATHAIMGYEHKLITLDNCLKTSRFVNECIEKENWPDAVDYLRLHYLNEEGGVYADSDCMIYENTNFDLLLNNRMFVGKETNGYLANWLIGSEPNHPFLKFMLNTMERCFRTDGEGFDTGMQFFTEAYYMADRKTLGMEIYEPEVIEPMVKHWSLKSWMKDGKPI